MKIIAAFGFILLVSTLVVLFPFMLPVGLNFLGFNIPLTIETWFGSFMIYGFIALASGVSRK